MPDPGDHDAPARRGKAQGPLARPRRSRLRGGGRAARRARAASTLRGGGRLAPRGDPPGARERAFGPVSLRWLRPATAIVAIALVVLLMGDFLNAFGSPGVNQGPGNLTLSATGGQLAPSATDIEKQTMVNVPGVMGQMALATAQSVGYANYTVVYSPPADEIATVPEKAGPTRTQGIFQVNTRVGWPLRQTEIGLGAVVVILIALVVFAWQRSRRVTVR